MNRRPFAQTATTLSHIYWKFLNELTELCAIRRTQPRKVGTALLKWLTTKRRNADR
jgi:hypothetical protein